MPIPLLAEMQAYLAYATSEDASMPDPLGHADLQWLATLPQGYGDLFLPELEHAYFANPVGSSWGARKKNRSLRQMTTVNPAAELRVRLALHPHSEALFAAQTDHAISNSYDLDRNAISGEAFLRRRSFKRTHSQLRKQLGDLRAGSHEHGFSTDITSFYPSVRPAQAAVAIADIAGEAAGREIHLLLERLEQETGVTGLPVGAEFSSLLSNLVLIPVDCAMDGFQGIRWLRWTDDILVVDGAPQLIDRAYQHLSATLEACGLSLSTTKTRSTTNPVSDWTVEDLIDQFVASQGDLQPLKNPKNPKIETVEFAEHALVAEIENPYRNASRLNRITGYLSLVPPEMQRLKSHIAEALLNNPQIWETAVPRTVRYLAQVATPEQWLELIELARLLLKEQPITDEQVAHIACAVVGHARAFETPSLPGELMQAIFQEAESAIVRGWALRAAGQLVPDRILPLIFDAQGFDFLSPLEQRWALGLAALPDHKTFLEEQARSGQWRLTARWRLATYG